MKVFKYPIEVLTEEQIVMMPRGAHILSAQIQPHQKLVLWAAVDPENPLEKRHILVAGTGWAIDGWGALKHIETAMTPDGEFVWHVFERVSLA